MIHDGLWWSNVGFQIPIHPWTEAPCVSCQELMLSMLCEGTSMLMPLCSYRMLGCWWILQATCNVMHPPIKLFLGGTTHWSSNQLPEPLHSFRKLQGPDCHEGSSPMISETTCAGSRKTHQDLRQSVDKTYNRIQQEHVCRHGAYFRDEKDEVRMPLWSSKLVKLSNLGACANFVLCTRLQRWQAGLLYFSFLEHSGSVLNMLGVGRGRWWLSLAF